MAKGNKKENNKDEPHRFEPGNQFWRKRSKHGRDAIFSDPNIMWDAACQYFDYAMSNPLPEEKVFGTGERMTVNKMKPFSIKALCLFWGCNEKYLNQFKASKSYSADFSSIIDTIEDVIETQQFEGAASGLLQANIIARRLGYADRRDITTNGESLNGFDELMKAASGDEQ